MDRAWVRGARGCCGLGLLVALGIGGCGGPLSGGWMEGEVERIELTFVDEGRATPSLGSLEGAESRSLDVVVHSRSGASSGRPLVVLAHGHGGDPTKLEPFADRLARRGYAVAAVRFPVSHEGSGAGFAGLGDLAEQPTDLGFVVDSLEEAAQDPEHALHQRFQTDRIAAIGHSLGGATVLGWTRYEEPDLRVALSVLVAPAVALTSVFGRHPTDQGPATLILHGTDDSLLSPMGSEELFEQLGGPTTLILIEGAEHSDLIEAASDPPIPVREATERATLGFLDATFRKQEARWWTIYGELAAEGHEVRFRP